MIAILSLLLVFALSLLIVRIGTIALVMTGVSEDAARFQALSAFSGTGFTTDESENVISRPARRRIITILIRAGSLGIITAISTLVLGFAGGNEAVPDVWKLGFLFVGVVGLVLLARSETMARIFTPIISRSLRRYTTLDLRDYAELLHLREDFRVVEIEAVPNGWLTKAPLSGLGLYREGVVLLGIVRKGGEFIGTPESSQCVHAGDKVILYGRASRIEELRTRSRADEGAHQQAVREHREEQKAQPD